MGYSLADGVGSYWVNDIPLEAYKSGVELDEAEVDLSGVTAVQATLYGPDGDDLTGYLPATVNDNQISVSWPAVSRFTKAGMYSLGVVLVTDSGHVQLDPQRFAVQVKNGWHTLDSARAEWQDAPADDSRLFTLLQIAAQQVAAYAPDLEDGAPVPTNYRYGQLMQARNLWNAGRVDPAQGNAEFGTSFVITPHPLDWIVRQILRPQRRVPVVA